MNFYALISGIILTPLGLSLFWWILRGPNQEVSVSLFIAGLLSAAFIAGFGIFALYCGAVP